MSTLFSVQLKALKTIAIASITSEQISEIVTLDQLCFGGLWAEDGYLREIESCQSSLLALAISESNTVNCGSKIIGIGCLWSIVEEAHITLLGIHPDYRWQGLGQLLLYVLLKDACQRKLKWATLEVKVNNSPAISLYKKFGFKIVGKRKGYYQQTGEDALVLWNKDLEKPEFSQHLEQWWQEIDERLSSRYMIYSDAIKQKSSPNYHT